MSAAVLLIPFLVLRFGLMGIYAAAAWTGPLTLPPMERGTRGAFWVYQLSSAGLFVGMFFENIHTQLLGFGAGLGLYLLGLGLLAAAVAAFCSPCQTGIRACLKIEEMTNFGPEGDNFKEKTARQSRD